MTDLAVLNPEIEGLLREIAADPTSTLLRLPPSDLRRARQHGHLPDRAGTTGLNLAERELLRRWREEVAYLLLVACYRELSSSSLYSHRVTSFGSGPCRRSGRIRHRMTSAVEYARFSGCFDLREAALLLQRCMASEASRAVEIFDAAAAAARLVSSDLATCYAALELILKGNPITGVRMMTLVRPRGLTARRMVAVNTVYGHERNGSLPSALDAIDNGDWPVGSEIVRAIAGCVLAAQVSNGPKLSQWVSRLTELHPSSASISEIVGRITQRKGRGDWKPAEGAEQRLRTALSHCPPELAEIANAFN